MATLQEARAAKAAFEAEYGDPNGAFAPYLQGIGIERDRAGWGCVLAVRLAQPLPPELTLPETYRSIVLKIQVV